MAEVAVIYLPSTEGGGKQESTTSWLPITPSMSCSPMPPRTQRTP
jgi:hypothetical protein